MKTRIKKIILLGLLTISTLMLTSCKSGLQDFAESTLPQAIRDRGEANKQLAHDFVTIGALSEAQYQKICENIDKQVAKYAATTDSGNVSTKTLGTVALAVSHYTLGGEGVPSYIVFMDDDDVPHNMVHDEDRYVYKEEGSVVAEVLDDTKVDANKDELVLSNFIISNYLHVYEFGHSKEASEVQPLPKDIEPIQMISKDVADSLNNLSKAQVYILRDDILAQTGESTLDGAIAKVQDAVNEPDKTNQQRLLANYFCQAKDNNGEYITLIDRDDETYDLIQDSAANDEDKNELGYDLIIGQYDMEDCIHVRFTEFNQEAYNALNKFVGQDTGRFFLVASDDGSWKAYLMQYPVYTINTMTDLQNEDNEVMVDFKKSGLGINIMTGKFVKYESTGVNEFDDMQATSVEASDYYLTLMASQNNDAEGISSLVLKGYGETVITDTSGKEHKCLTGRVVLRDYLESTYAPAYDSGDDSNLSVFGRKIRFDMADEFWEECTSDSNQGDKNIEGTFNVKQSSLVYKKKGNIAYFVDKDGVQINNTPYLQVTDFCDAYKLYKTDVVARLPFIGEDRTTIDSKVQDGETPAINKIECTTELDSLEPTMMFPSVDLGKADFKTDSNTKQRFYTITTTKGLFDSALYSSWINSTSTTASLDWWNTYLADNNFSYNVNHEDVNNYLLGNYKYELSQQGMVILDLETVATIQEMYDKEDDKYTLSFIRTIFILIGWGLIVASSLIMLFWVFDTNTDLGIKLLEKVTLGHWVAVKYEDDIPSNKTKGIEYITAPKLIVKCIIVITIGILLIKVNIFVIIQFMVHLFGGVASKIDEVIKGLK